MRFASLGSGSEGNALLVQSGPPRSWMTAASACARSSSAVPVWASTRRASTPSSSPMNTAITSAACRAWRAASISRVVDLWHAGGDRVARDGCTLRGFDSTTHFAVGETSKCSRFQSRMMPASRRRWWLTDGDRRLGVLTDVGETTGFIESSLRGCDALFLEANHCEDMLAISRYPASLKARIAGRYGHLSNRVAALCCWQRLAHGGLQRVVAWPTSAARTIGPDWPAARLPRPGR